MRNVIFAKGVCAEFIPIKRNARKTTRYNFVYYRNKMQFMRFVQP